MKRTICVSLSFFFLLVSVAFTQGFPTVQPEYVGLSSQRLLRINEDMQKKVDDGLFAGMVTAIVRRGKLAHFETFGMMDIEAGKEMRPDAIFRIYSMSKPITCAALMMLYEEGKFHLNDPVEKFIPEFKNLTVFAGEDSEPVPADHTMRVKDLILHTAGFTYGKEGHPVKEMYLEKNVLYGNKNLKEFIQDLSSIPLMFQPGTQWEYGMSIDVLGYLIEVLSGMTFDEFLRQRVFDPLNMNDTGFCVPEGKRDRFAQVYGRNEEEKLIPFETKRDYKEDTSVFSGGGGLVSTTNDYLRFAQMLLNKGELDGVRLLSRKTVELMTKNHVPLDLIPNGPASNKGFGFGLGGRVLLDVARSEYPGSVGEFSWGGAASTFFWIDPKEELTGIVMPQLRASNRINNDYKILVYQAIAD